MGGVAIMLQIVTGVFLALHYTSDLNSAYFSLFFLIREVYYGWCLRYFHSSGASFGFLFLHLFYLHFLSSSNPLRNSTNNKIPFFPFIFYKDFFGFILVLCLYFLQTHFGISSLSHPDNALEACALLTPLHIVPEWYFLCQYAMLKAVPNKNAGFIILLTSVLILFFFGE